MCSYYYISIFALFVKRVNTKPNKSLDIRVSIVLLPLLDITSNRKTILVEVVAEFVIATAVIISLVTEAEAVIEVEVEVEVEVDNVEAEAKTFYHCYCNDGSSNYEFFTPSSLLLIDG